MAQHTVAARPVDNNSVFTEEHELFRETCRRFYEKELEPNYVRWELVRPSQPTS